MPVSSAQFKVRLDVSLSRKRDPEWFAQTGDLVEYRPIGGAHDNVSHSRGEIEKVFEAEDGSVRYAIRNENTGKTTNYQVWVFSVRSARASVDINAFCSSGVQHRWQDRARLSDCNSSLCSL